MSESKMTTWCRQTARRLLGFGGDAEGFVLMSTLAIFLFLFVFCSSIYAIGETIHQRIKLQNACDAAAYSAAVVQADGLSRMASINRAMSWTYVQMTNRQMDYITYRWLRQTCKQFQEDLDNAKNFHAHLLLPLDKEYTWVGMVIEAIGAVAVNTLLDIFHLTPDCCGERIPGKKYEWIKDLDRGHNDEGLAYWCGLAPGTTRHEISLNGKPPSISWEAARQAIVDSIVQYFITRENIESVLNLLSPAFGEDAERLGLLIDFDKTNIELMNRALPMVNYMMVLSMRSTAENVLKSMLKDRRLDDEDILEDYFISIKIPDAPNPYLVENVASAPDSYFSALHNTEADERLFLQMHSPAHADGSLAAFFPVLGGAGGEMPSAYGLDQWFIRGRGIYENAENDEACLLGQQGGNYCGGKSGYVTESGDIRLTGTERSEGALGIQRVYKDANLNETGAGAFMRNVYHGGVEQCVRRYSINDDKPQNGKDGILRDVAPESDRGRLKEVSAGEYNSHKERLETIKNETMKYVRDNYPPCCADRAEYYFRRSRTRSAHTFYCYFRIPEHGSSESSHHPVSRGNHLVSGASVIEALSKAGQSFVGQVFAPEDDDPGADGENDIIYRDGDDYESAFDEAGGDMEGQLADLRQQLADSTDPEEKKKLQEDIDELEKNLSDYAVARKEREKMAGDLADAEKKRDDILNGDSGGTSTGDSSGGNGSGGILGRIADMATRVLSGLFAECFDIQASCGNDNSRSFAEIPMCRKVSTTYALYSQYRWASAKWYCVSSLYTYGFCMLFNHRKVFSDWKTKKYIWFRIGGKYGFDIRYELEGKGHWHFPKWFDGAGPNYPLDLSSYNFSPGFLGRALRELNKFLPPDPLVTGLEDIASYGPVHGYMENINDLVGLVKPVKQFQGGRNERDEFENCAMFLDGDFLPSPLASAFAGLFQGHARIYGDDKHIFDNRYVGAKCKPWVLNERFFAGGGTIVVGAAMKHRNPFVQFFDFISREQGDAQNLPDPSVLSAFNIPEGNVMWTMAAARAGVRRHRRNGLFDQDRQYQVTYDPTSDVENLHYAPDGPFYFRSDGLDPNTGTWERIEATSDPAWGGMDGEELRNPQALSRADIEGQETVAIWDGCPCESQNAQAFREVWNLCEWDWDATLIPLRYAFAHALLQLSEKDGETRLDGLPYQERLKAIDAMREHGDGSGDSLADSLARNDDYIGDGRHWVWDMDDLMSVQGALTRDAFLVSPWKRATATFFEDVAAAAAAGLGNAGASYLNNFFQGLDLETKFPYPMDGKDQDRLLYENLMRSNRIL